MPLTLSWQGYKNGDFGRGGALNAPPIETVKFKLHWCLRSQNRGFWVWPAQLDYSHIATTCISRVFTCISRFSTFLSLNGLYVNMWNTHARHIAALKIMLACAINPFSNSSHVLCSFRNKKIVQFYDFKMTLGSQMELQNNFLGNFLSRRVKILQIYIETWIVIIKEHLESPSLKHKSWFCQGGALNAPPPCQDRVKIM